MAKKNVQDATLKNTRMLHTRINRLEKAHAKRLHTLEQAVDAMSTFFKVKPRR